MKKLFALLFAAALVTGCPAPDDRPPVHEPAGAPPPQEPVQPMEPAPADPLPPEPVEPPPPTGQPDNT